MELNFKAEDLLLHQRVARFLGLQSEKVQAFLGACDEILKVSLRRSNVTHFGSVLAGRRATVGRVWSAVRTTEVLLLFQRENVLVGDLLEGLWDARTGVAVEGFQVGRCGEPVLGALVVDNLLSKFVVGG